MKNPAPLRFMIMCVMGLLYGAVASGQQTVMHPRAGDPLRKTLFNAMRPAIERDLKQKVIFQVRDIRVYQGWAFLTGQPLQPDQTPINYKKTRYQEDVQQGAFGGEYTALLHKINGSWKLVTYNIGATDVTYADWWRRFHAPKAVIPYNE